jgi:hypothetical protein
MRQEISQSLSLEQILLQWCWPDQVGIFVSHVAQFAANRIPVQGCFVGAFKDSGNRIVVK